MDQWALRQRDTNRLARIMATHVLGKRSPTADQLYALSKLSWITDSYEGSNASYIVSTKIPALGELIGKTYDRRTTLQTVARDVQDETGNQVAAKLVLGDTGFTNFYKAYRNSVRDWVHDHRAKLLPMFRAALAARTNGDRLELVRKIESLPGIPKANHPDQTMKPEYFLTPVFFMLDPEVRFPIINGNKWVRALLAKLEVDGTDLASQYKAMAALYGKHGVKDAADLDLLGRDLPDFLDTPDQKATKRILVRRGEDERDLPQKDEADYDAAREATTIAHRRIHNQLTNALHDHLTSKWALTEGLNECKFDAAVKRYNGEDDLLIEAKSSAALPHVRMAVGQLFNYWFQLHGDTEDHHLAVLLPERPSKAANDFLEWVEIGALWFEGKVLKTHADWLANIAEVTAPSRT